MHPSCKAIRIAITFKLTLMHHLHFAAVAVFIWSVPPWQIIRTSNAIPVLLPFKYLLRHDTMWTESLRSPRFFMFFNFNTKLQHLFYCMHNISFILLNSKFYAYITNFICIINSIVTHQIILIN